MRGECSHHTARPPRATNTLYKIHNKVEALVSGHPQLGLTGYGNVKTQSFSASYPGQFALSELPEEAWNRLRLFPTSLTGDVTSEIVEDDWERGCEFVWELVKTAFCVGGRKYSFPLTTVSVRRGSTVPLYVQLLLGDL